MSQARLWGVLGVLAATAMGAATVAAAERTKADPKPGVPATAKSVKEMQEDFLRLNVSNHQRL